MTGHETREMRLLRQFREREVTQVFNRVPDRAIPYGLELGAGEGYQSRLLQQWVERLIVTELNPERLLPVENARVEYRISDAQDVGSDFPPQTFDLVYSSNLLEHLPRVHDCLLGVRQVLKDDGVAIHAMPNRVWKTSQLIFFYPRKVVNAVHRLRTGSAPNAGFNFDNNLGKAGRPGRSLLRRLVPQPHGAFDSHQEEFVEFGQKQWVRRFEAAGFEVKAILTSPFSSGYRFGADPIRRLLERYRIGSEYIYVTVKQGCDSPFLRYFTPETEP